MRDCTRAPGRPEALLEAVLPRIPHQLAHARRWLRRIATVADAGVRSSACPPPPRYYLGIDPGQSGAVAVLDAKGTPALLADIPLRFQPGRRARATYDLVAIRAMLAPWRRQRALVVVELPGPMPRFIARGRGQHQVSGSKANYNRGVCEAWTWMLAGMRWPAGLVRTVRPQQWQAVMLRGARGTDTGEKAIAVARRRWRGLDLRRTERCTVPAEGRVDALLLAEFGRREALSSCYHCA